MDAIWKNRELEKLIGDLRAEAAAQKACITQYTFQAIGFTALGWGLVLKADGTEDGLYLCGILIVFLLMSVVRLANHKYGTVNRNLGYELHLYRLKDYARIGNKAWAERILDIGWEEAMCAWRIVQPTLFRFLYASSPSALPYRLREKHRNVVYRWWDTKSLVVESANYHPGNYLRNVQLVLHFSALFSLTTMWFLYFSKISPHYLTWQQFGIGVVLVAMSVLFIVRFFRERSFRKILEDEFLSIQSSAVVWRLVSTAHILASEMALHRYNSYKHYTKFISEVAVSMTVHFDNIHGWMAHWENAAPKDSVFEELGILSNDPSHRFDFSLQRN